MSASNISSLKHGFNYNFGQTTTVMTNHARTHRTSSQQISASISLLIVLNANINLSIWHLSFNSKKMVYKGFLHTECLLNLNSLILTSQFHLFKGIIKSPHTRKPSTNSNASYQTNANKGYPLRAELPYA